MLFADGVPDDVPDDEDGLCWLPPQAYRNKIVAARQTLRLKGPNMLRNNSLMAYQYATSVIETIETQPVHTCCYGYSA